MLRAKIFFFCLLGKNPTDTAITCKTPINDDLHFFFPHFAFLPLFDSNLLLSKEEYQLG